MMSFIRTTSRADPIMIPAKVMNSRSSQPEPEERDRLRQRHASSLSDRGRARRGAVPFP